MDSPFQKHLGTNYTPTADEVRGIQLVLDATAQEMITLDAQIDKVRRQLDSLQEKRTRIHNFGEQHRALLSPVRRLTADILEYIFLACLPSDRNPCMSATEAPMLLTRICSSWRQIAMSAPRLWAAIHIALPSVRLYQYSEEREVTRQEALVHRVLKRREMAVSEWLGRSGVCSLSISIFEEIPWSSRGDADKEIQNLHLSLIVNTLMPYHQQWRELDMCLDDDTLHGILSIGLKAGSLKALKSFHVSRLQPRYYRMARLNYRWKDVLALLPSHLTSATFNGFHVFPSDFSSISLPTWQGLTELNLFLSRDAYWDSLTTNIDELIMGSVLCHCHSLVALTLKIQSYDLEPKLNPDAEKIVLPRLTSLSIVLPASSDGVAIAKRLFLPSLANITVQFFSTSSNMETYSEILRSLLTSGGDIHTLNLCTPSEWMHVTDDLIQILKMAPGIRSLTISTEGVRRKWEQYGSAHPGSYQGARYIVTDTLLQALSPSGNDDLDIVCPMLEEFVCTPEVVTRITERGLISFLKARKLDHRVPNIRRLTVFIDEPKEKHILGEERISLEAELAVYFTNKSMPPSISPFDGHKSEVIIDPASPFEVYTEL